MTDSELTVSILREIRDSIRTLDTNLSTRIDRLDANLSRRIDALGERVDALGERVDALGERVTVVEYAVRDAGQQLVMITRYLKNKTEVEVEDLKQRVTTLEIKVG
jgi:polyhydroxyalkanoate synthesis regulator phasin